MFQYHKHIHNSELDKKNVQNTEIESLVELTRLLSLHLNKLAKRRKQQGKTLDRKKHNMKRKYEMANPSVKHDHDCNPSAKHCNASVVNVAVPAHGDSNIAVPPPEVNQSVTGQEDPKDTDDKSETDGAKDPAKASKQADGAH